MLKYFASDFVTQSQSGWNRLANGLSSVLVWRDSILASFQQQHLYLYNTLYWGDGGSV